MGSFSVNFAEITENTISRNLMHDMPFKLLIPKEFGGGYILDKSYQDYGDIENSKTEEQYDWYDLIASWNIPYLEEYKENLNKFRLNLIKEFLLNFPEFYFDGSNIEIKDEILDNVYNKALKILNNFLKTCKEYKKSLINSRILELEDYYHEYKMSKEKETNKDDFIVYEIRKFRYLRELTRLVLNIFIEDSIKDFDDKFIPLFSYYEGEFSSIKIDLLKDRINDEYSFEFENLPIKDKYPKLRNYGIDLSIYDFQHSCLKYPLKIVPHDWEGTYEDCIGFSKRDPEQGYWSEVIEENYPLLSKIYEADFDTFSWLIRELPSQKEIKEYLQSKSTDLVDLKRLNKELLKYKENYKIENTK